MLEVMVKNPPTPTPVPAPALPEPEKKVPSIFEVDKTKKHYLPQFFLEGFSSNGRQLHVFDKEASLGNAFRTTSVAKVERSWRAYSARSDYYITKHIEPGILSALSFIRSNPVSEVNDRLSNGDSSDSLRQWLARFIVDFRLRSRGFRENQETRKLFDIHRKIAEASNEGRRACYGARISAYLSARDISFDDYESWEREFSNLDDYQRWVATSLKPFVAGEQGLQYYDEYASANMRLFESSPGRQFICSDMPSTTLALGEEYPNFLFFYIPVDKHRVLTGFLRDAQAWDIVQESYTDEDVDRANVLAFQDAHRFVYSPSMDELKSTYKSCVTQLDEHDS